MNPQLPIPTASHPPTEPATPVDRRLRELRNREIRRQALDAAVRYSSGTDHRLTRETLWGLVEEFERYLTTGEHPPTPRSAQANAAGDPCIVYQEGP